MKSPPVVLRGEIVGAEGEKGSTVFESRNHPSRHTGPECKSASSLTPNCSIGLARFHAVLIGGMDFETRGQRLLILKCDPTPSRPQSTCRVARTWPSRRNSMDTLPDCSGQFAAAKIRQPDYKLRDLPCQQRSVLHFDAKGRCALAGVLSRFPQHRHSSRRGPVAWFRFEVQHHDPRAQLSLCLSLKLPKSVATTGAATGSPAESWRYPSPRLTPSSTKTRFARTSPPERVAFFHPNSSPASSGASYVCRCRSRENTRFQAAPR